MKKVFCPRCDNSVIFDETHYSEGQSLQLHCTVCGRNFGVRIVRKKKEASEDNIADTSIFGYISVIENVFGYKQEFPLREGDNIIGRRSKGTEVQIPILTDDPSMGRQHCVINVKPDKNGKMVYTLRDFPSVTGTFLMNDCLGKNERVVLHEDAIITIGATTFIVHLSTGSKE